MTTDRFDDQLRSALLAEVPEPGDDYWQRIDAALGAPGTNDITPTEPDEAPSKPRIPVWPAIAAAALIMAGILVIGNRWGRDSEQLVAGEAAGQDAGAGNGPRQNLDHWQGLYAVWDCTLNDGEGGWVPEFQSTADDWGIHSHGDGLLSIHPFFENSAEQNATLALFAETMGIEITDEAITLDDGRVLSEATTTCGGEPGVVQVRRWPSAPALEEDPALAPRVVTSDIAAERFMNNLEVWTIAFAPLEADLPLPPRDRFDRLAGSWFPPVDYRPTSVPAASGDVVPEDADRAISVPPLPRSDEGTYLRREEDSVAATRLLQETLDEIQDPNYGTTSDPLLPTARHFVATAVQSRNVVDLFLFGSRDRGQPERIHDCFALRNQLTAELWTTGCNFDDGRGNPLPVRQQSDHVGESRSLAVWNLPASARWLFIDSDDGSRIVVNVIDGAALAIWRADRGSVTNATAFDADSTVVWTS